VVAGEVAGDGEEVFEAVAGVTAMRRLSGHTYIRGTL
jgi:hypothetical protein